MNFLKLQGDQEVLGAPEKGEKELLVFKKTSLLAIKLLIR